MNGSERFVTMRGGLTVPLTPLMLVLDLEARGIRLTADEDGAIVATPRGRLTDAERDELRRYRNHVLALLAYQPDDSHLYQQLQ